MIEITVTVEEDEAEFSITGHGPSIVCAGISAIKGTMENYVQFLYDHDLIQPPRITDDGDTSTIAFKTQDNQAINCFIDAVFLMFMQFADQYPGDVSCVLIS